MIITIRASYVAQSSRLRVNFGLSGKHSATLQLIGEY